MLDFLQQFGAFARDDEVVGIAHKVHLSGAGLAVLLSGGILGEKCLNAVEGDVGQCGGDYPALRRALVGDVEHVLLNDPSPQPSAQHPRVDDGVL